MSDLEILFFAIAVALAALTFVVLGVPHGWELLNARRRDVKLNEAMEQLKEKKDKNEGITRDEIERLTRELSFGQYQKYRELVGEVLAHAGRETVERRGPAGTHYRIGSTSHGRFELGKFAGTTAHLGFTPDTIAEVADRMSFLAKVPNLQELGKRIALDEATPENYILLEDDDPSMPFLLLSQFVKQTKIHDHRAPGVQYVVSGALGYTQWKPRDGKREGLIELDITRIEPEVHGGEWFSWQDEDDIHRLSPLNGPVWCLTYCQANILRVPGRHVYVPREQDQDPPLFDVQLLRPEESHALGDDG